MAGIDKTYVNWEQYKEIRAFFTKEMKTKQREDLGFYFGYCKYIKKDFNNSELPIWNTSTIVDMWLANNCKLTFVQERLDQQYPDNWIGWKILDFNSKGFLVEAKLNNNYIAPFKELSEDMVDIYNSLLIYGTTYAYNFLNQVLQGVVRGEFYKIKEENIEATFEIFGHFITYKKGKYYIDGKKITYLYSPIPYLFKGDKDSFYKYFQEYNITHSFNKKDVLKYEPEQIIMSHENECFNVDIYKDFDKNNMERYFLYLPEYIKNNLK